MGTVFSQQEDIPCKNLLFLPRWTPPFWEFDGFSICSGPGGSKFIVRPNAFEPPAPTQNIPPSKYFYDVILLAYLVQLFWGIGACILAPGGPREAPWGHQRAFGAGSTMDCPNSLIEIEISSEKPRVGHLG
jgi:hypothetical protein